MTEDDSAFRSTELTGVSEADRSWAALTAGGQGAAGGTPGAGPLLSAPGDGFGERELCERAEVAVGGRGPW